MKVPTKLKKMDLNSVDFVRRGANPEAHIALHKSYDGEEMDIAKAEQDLTMFTDVLGESFSSIMKDDTLSHEEKAGMIAKSMDEFTDTLEGYLHSSFSILEKSAEGTKTTQVTQKQTGKGEETMQNTVQLENVDKSLLSPAEAAFLDAIVAKACKTTKSDEGDVKPGKVDPSKAAEGEEEDLPPAVKKAVSDMEEMKKSYEMKALEEVAKKYECLGKKPSEEAAILYDLKKSGDKNYNAYIAAMDAQVEMQKGIFSEIGKSGSYHYAPVAKGEAETRIEGIAKSYREKDPTLSEAEALAKAWEMNPDLFNAYEQNAGY